MTGQSEPRQIAYLLAYLAALALVGIGLVFLPEEAILRPGLVMPEGDIVKTVLDQLTGIQTFVGTLDTSLFVACGLLVIRSREQHIPLGRVECYAIVFTLICAAISFYGLYLFRISILEMVAGGFLNIHALRLREALVVQYYGLFASAASLGIVFIRMLDAPMTPARGNEPSATHCAVAPARRPIRPPRRK